MELCPDKAMHLPTQKIAFGRTSLSMRSSLAGPQLTLGEMYNEDRDS